MIKYIKYTYQKLTAKIILNSETLKAFPEDSFTVATQHYTGSCNSTSWDKKKKDIHTGKEKVKLSLFKDNMIIFR